MPLKLGMLLKNFFVLLISIGLFPIPSWSEEERLPLWEYGAGIGGVRFEHYPASDESATIALPFPTFQYRGEILRADDREGARAYLLRTDRWNLEMGGGGQPGIGNKNNKAREGMEELMWGVQIGPQVVAELSDSFRFKFGVYKSIVSNFNYSKANGNMFKAQLIYLLDNFFSHSMRSEKLKSRGQVTVSMKSASQEFHATYFEVPDKYATPERPAYQAREGFLETETSYFQSITSHRTTFYISITNSNYSNSVNRASPLHKADQTWNFGLGITYVLGESLRSSIPEDDAEGLIDKVRHHPIER